MKKHPNCGAVHSLGEDATARRAHFLTRLAAFRIVGIANYSASSRLANHVKKRTLHAVQLMILGLLLILSIITGCSGERYTELMNASRDGNNKAVLRSIKNGSFVNERSSQGKSALMMAASNGHTETAKLLIDHGADVKIRDNYQTTAIIVAATAGKAETVELLVQHGADPTFKDSSGGSALSNATFFGHTETIHRLLRTKPALSKQDGDELLMLAAGLGHYTIAKELLEYGVDPNARGVKDRSPLLAAAAFNKIDVVKLLLQHGADATATDTDGVSPIQIAREKGNEEIVKLLSTKKR